MGTSQLTGQHVCIARMQPSASRPHAAARQAGVVGPREGCRGALTVYVNAHNDWGRMHAVRAAEQAGQELVTQVLALRPLFAWLITSNTGIDGSEPPAREGAAPNNSGGTSAGVARSVPRRLCAHRSHQRMNRQLAAPGTLAPGIFHCLRCARCGGRCCRCPPGPCSHAALQYLFTMSWVVMNAARKTSREWGTAGVSVRGGAPSLACESQHCAMQARPADCAQGRTKSRSQTQAKTQKTGSHEPRACCPAVRTSSQQAASSAARRWPGRNTPHRQVRRHRSRRERRYSQ